MLAGRLDPQMPRQHQRRHAQPVRADVEGEAQRLAPSPGPSRCGRAGGPRTGGRRGGAAGAGRGDRRAVEAAGEPQRARRPAPASWWQPGALAERRARNPDRRRRIRAAAGRCPTGCAGPRRGRRRRTDGRRRGRSMSAGERMRRPLSSATLSAISAAGVGRRPRGQRQDGVVDVDHPVAGAVDQRRQLVHPAAVIDVVIAVGLLHPLPAGVEQRRLDRVEARRAAPGCRDRRRCGRRWRRDRRRGRRCPSAGSPARRAAPARGAPFPPPTAPGCAPAPASRRAASKMRRDPRRDRPPLHPEGEAADQLLGAGGADQRRPSRSRRREAGSRSARTRSRASSCRELPPEVLDQADRACRCRDSRSPAPDWRAISRVSASKPRAPERDIIGRGLGQAHEHLGRADARAPPRASPKRGNRISAGRARLPHPRERVGIGAHVADLALGRAVEPRAEAVRPRPRPPSPRSRRS